MMPYEMKSVPSSASSAEEASQAGVNVFRIPHSRMKELVDERLRQVPKIKTFSKEDRERLDTLLQVS